MAKRAVLPTPNIPLSDPTWYQWFQGVDEAIKRFETLEANAAIVALQAGILRLTDGVTAPAAVVGVAQVYVDTADGDLKVRFADAVTKTIETDT